MTKRGLVVAVIAGVLATIAPFGAPARAVAPERAEDPRRGVVFDGLTPGNRPGCEFELPAGPRRARACTHGPDPAPPGIDIKHRDPVRAAATANAGSSTTALATSSVPCYGDGTTGARVEAIYAVPTGTTDRYSTVVPYIRQWAAAVDGVFVTSAAETGGERHVRWVTDAGCNLVVRKVQVTATGAADFANTVDELLTKGYTRTDRKYLVWMDADVYCGIGEVFLDDIAGALNANNGANTMFARVDTGCWGVPGRSVEAHELMHMLGAVQASAPHSTPHGHCWDGHDLMCYDDGSDIPVEAVCSSSHSNVFDCNHDDYFSTAPPPSSYLGTHWNTASSSFLASTAPPAWHLTSMGAPPGGLTGRLGVVSRGPSRLDVVGRGKDNALWYTSYLGGVWQPWQSLGGVVSSSPTIASWGVNHLDVFVRGGNGALWHRWFDGSWHEWESLGGILTSAPAAASAGSGRIDVFVRGTDNGLWQLPWNNGWRSWQSLGGTVTADPATVSPAAGRLDVYVRGTDNGLWIRTTSGAGWSGWASLGGVLTSGPAAASWGSGRRDVFVRGTDNGWWQRTWNGASWSGWSSLGTAITSAPAAASWGSGRIDTIGIAADGTAWDRWWG